MTVDPADEELTRFDFPVTYHSYALNQHRTGRGYYDSADEANTDAVVGFDWSPLQVRDQREGRHLQVGGTLGVASEMFRFINLLIESKRDTYAKLYDAEAVLSRVFDLQECQIDSPTTRGILPLYFWSPTVYKGLAQSHIGATFSVPPTSTWRLGEAFGSFRDVGSLGTAHGTVAGAPSRAQASIFGDGGPDRCIVATAASQGVSFGDVYGNTGATAWSVTGWIKWGGNATTMNVLSKYGGSPANGWRCQVTASGFLSMATLNAGTVQALSGTHSALVAGELHHVAFVFDASELRLYLDGVKVGSVARSQNPGTSTGIAMAVDLGNAGLGGPAGAAAQELMMWQGNALSDAQVEEVYRHTAVLECFFARPSVVPAIRSRKSEGKRIAISTQLVCEDPRRYLGVAPAVPWSDLANALYLPNWTTGMGAMVHPVITIVMSGNGASNLTISDGTRSLVLDMSAAGAGTFTIDVYNGSIFKGSTRRDDLRSSSPSQWPVVLAGGSSWTMTNRTNVTSASIAYRPARSG